MGSYYNVKFQNIVFLKVNIIAQTSKTGICPRKGKNMGMK